MYKLDSTLEFDEWLNEQPAKHQLQINERLTHIIDDGYFGDHKHLEGPLWELKWNIGWRVYYAYIAEYNILLILGGNKNGQSKDINKAKKILRKYAENSP